MAGELHPMQTLTLREALLAERALQQFRERLTYVHTDESVLDRQAASGLLERCDLWRSRQAKVA